MSRYDGAMKTFNRLCLLIAALAPLSATAQPALFDVHVHLHHGEKSLLEYEQQAADDKVPLTGYGVMWFGGPNQALQGDPAGIRANNDALLAMAAKHPPAMPIMTVHPYDGEAALAELARVARKGAKVLKIHPHTQRFDAADPRVLTLVKRAGELGVIVLMDNASIVPADCEKLFNLALAAPGTNFIFAHLGGMNFRFWNILAAAAQPRDCSARTSTSTSRPRWPWSQTHRYARSLSGPCETWAPARCCSGLTTRSIHWRRTSRLSSAWASRKMSSGRSATRTRAVSSS